MVFAEKYLKKTNKEEVDLDRLYQALDNFLVDKNVIPKKNLDPYRQDGKYKDFYDAGIWGYDPSKSDVLTALKSLLHIKILSSVEKINAGNWSDSSQDFGGERSNLAIKNILLANGLSEPSMSLINEINTTLNELAGQYNDITNKPFVRM